MVSTKPLLRFDYHLRSRYCETDQMGYVYHGRYLEYFETARTEFVRKMGITYKSLEDHGVMMPVRDASLTYLRPVLYDENITISLFIYEMPSVRLATHYEISGPDGSLRVKGSVTLIFMDKNTRKPCRPPNQFINGINSFVNNG